MIVFPNCDISLHLRSAVPF